jgi:hypothetical protein
MGLATLRDVYTVPAWAEECLAGSGCAPSCHLPFCAAHAAFIRTSPQNTHGVVRRQVLHRSDSPIASYSTCALPDEVMWEELPEELLQQGTVSLQKVRRVACTLKRVGALTANWFVADTAHPLGTPPRTPSWRALSSAHRQWGCQYACGVAVCCVATESDVACCGVFNAADSRLATCDGGLQHGGAEHHGGGRCGAAASNGDAARG